MEEKIFMPSDDDARRMIENAWQEFCQQAGAIGMPEQAVSLMKDIFVWGYCAGHNDILGIIRDQMAVGELVKKIEN